MTLNQFFEKLEQTPRDWYLYDVAGMGILVIRCGTNNQHCPLTRLSGNGAVSLDITARALGLSLRTAKRIADCADAEEHIPGYTNLRARLLKACGL